MNRWSQALLVLVLLSLPGSGWALLPPVRGLARAGDTVAIALGGQPHLTRQTLTVTLTPAYGLPLTYKPNDPHIRAVVTLYADPLSSLLLGTHPPGGTTAAPAATSAPAVAAPLQEADRTETWLYLDLPETVPAGPLTVLVMGPKGAVTAQPVTIEIVSGAGQSVPRQEASATPGAQASARRLALLEQAEHYTVRFAGTVVPHTIQVELFRTAGIGTPLVVNSQGDWKNLAWSDDGGKLRVVLTPTTGQTLAALGAFTFHVAGGVSGLQVASVAAYDRQGARLRDVVALIEGGRTEPKK